MSIWWRAPVLSLAGILGAIGVLGGFDAHHFPAYFKDAAAMAVMFLGIPIVAFTIVMIVLERFLGKYGRSVVALICAAPGLIFYVLYLINPGDGSYLFTLLVCFVGWAALWFITAPRASA
jgi:uncharacterized membrane protein YGL010W